MSDAHINYVPRHDATPEDERAALGRVWSLIFSSQEMLPAQPAAAEEQRDRDDDKGDRRVHAPDGIGTP